MTISAVQLVLCMAALGACAKSPSVSCGKGTVQRDSVCEVVPAGSTLARADVSLADATTGSAVGATATWTYRHDPDPMRNVTTEGARLQSKNSVRLGPPYGESHAALYLRYGPQGAREPGLAMIIAVEHGQFYCSVEGCLLHARFDDGQVETMWASEAEDGTRAVLPSQPADWLARIKKAKHLVIEAPIFQEGERQFEFDVDGLVWDHGMSPPPKSRPSKWCFGYTPEPTDGVYVTDDETECFTPHDACEQRRNEILKTKTIGTVTSCEKSESRCVGLQD